LKKGAAFVKFYQTAQEAHMERLIKRFIERQNIFHYVDQLKTETNPIKQKTLQRLLAEGETKQANHAKEIKKPQG
jgi:hypothetical protein